MRTNLRKNERGAALLETAITIPIILLIAVGIFEFGRAYQTWQVLTNAAREGARIAILVDKTDADVAERGQELHDVRRTAASDTAVVNINRNVRDGYQHRLAESPSTTRSSSSCSTPWSGW